MTAAGPVRDSTEWVVRAPDGRLLLDCSSEYPRMAEALASHMNPQLWSVMRGLGYSCIPVTITPVGETTDTEQIQGCPTAENEVEHG